ncbi:MAG: hypothetical protein K2I91_04175, partial [Muribaculaceae bacterium]|nr:hypothetical protein [Muribaculaceae bacterium]
MKINIIRITSIALVVVAGLNHLSVRACTSAVISAGASASGRPLLWKHRDTSTTDNKVEYVPGEDGYYSYVALFNASDRDLAEAWTGMNEVGFAIMNTASYNIKDDNVPDKEMDKEGLVMTLALKSCRTIDDFAQLLGSLPRPMGVEANFGVIDASGKGAVFETNNHSYVRYDTSDAEGGVIIRTNYSHSGRPGEGYGYVREANAEHLMSQHISAGDITPEFLTETVSRSFYHDVHRCDDLKRGDKWLIDVDYIPRYKSTATIVIEGCVPDEDSDCTPSDIINQYIMWTGLGYPPCAEIVPVWCHPDGVPSELRGLSSDGHSSMGDKVKARRSEVFSMRKGKDPN